MGGSFLTPLALRYDLLDDSRYSVDKCCIFLSFPYFDLHKAQPLVPSKKRDTEHPQRTLLQSRYRLNKTAARDQSQCVRMLKGEGTFPWTQFSSSTRDTRCDMLRGTIALGWSSSVLLQIISRNSLSIFERARADIEHRTALEACINGQSPDCSQPMPTATEDLIHVPQLWALIMGADRMITAGPIRSLALQGSSIEVKETAKAAAGTKRCTSVRISFINQGKLQELTYPISQCASWFGLLNKHHGFGVS